MSTLNDSSLDSLLTAAFSDVHPSDRVVGNACDAVRAAADSGGAGTPAKGAAPVQPAGASVSAEPDAGKATSSAGASRGFAAVRKRPRRWVRTVAVAACLLLALAVPLGIHVYRDVSAVISIDINPSIELSLNRFDRVVAARGLNDDGAALLEQVPVKGMTCDDALERLLSSEPVRNAADGGSNPVEVVVSSLSGGDTSGLESKVDRASQAAGCASRCSSADSDEVEAADAVGLSVGKYRMYERLNAAGCAVSADEVRDMSMKQLRDLAGSYEDELERGASGASAASGSDGAGGGCSSSSGMMGEDRASDSCDDAGTSDGTKRRLRMHSGGEADSRAS